MIIDFYTTIIDNYWDIWFSFNLAISLQYYNENIKVRFFCDNENIFNNMMWNKNIKNITFYDLKEIKKLKPSKYIFNFFDRKIDYFYYREFDFDIKIINFSYFLMHTWVKSLHMTNFKSFNSNVTHYIPSLLKEWWWVIINKEIIDFKNNFELKNERKKFFPNLDDSFYSKEWISIFCYNETFDKIKDELFLYEDKIFFIFDNFFIWKNIINMPFLEINDYYKIQFLCDKNIVRWENSLVNSLLTTKPFLWDIYKEHNLAHNEKIDDFSNYLLNVSVDFKKYNEIFYNFNIWDTKKSFKNFLENKYFFTDISYNVVNNDLVLNIINYLNFNIIKKNTI